MKSPADLLAQYIQANTSLVLGTDLFVSSEPPSPDACVTIYDAGGRDPIDNINMDVDGIQWQPSVQVRVRNPAYTAAWSQLEDVRRVILGVADYDTINGTLVDRLQSAVGRGGVTSLGDDESERSRVTYNFDLLVSRFTVPAAGASAFLWEDGTHILWEDGSKILMN